MQQGRQHTRTTWGAGPMNVWWRSAMPEHQASHELINACAKRNMRWQDAGCKPDKGGPFVTLSVDFSMLVAAHGRGALQFVHAGACKSLLPLMVVGSGAKPCMQCISFRGLGVAGGRYKVEGLRNGPLMGRSAALAVALRGPRTLGRGCCSSHVQVAGDVVPCCPGAESCVCCCSCCCCCCCC
jgi:hypothetical protein